MDKNNELKVIQDTYDLTLWMIGQIEKFPRQHKYGIGVGIEQRLQRIMELLLRAKYAKAKAVYLADANIELDLLLYQLRLAKDVRALPVKSQGRAVSEIIAIGKQVSGWLASRTDKP